MTEQCSARATSQVMPDHVHTCCGKEHKTGDHLCLECGRWWWGKGTHLLYGTKDPTSL